MRDRSPHFDLFIPLGGQAIFTRNGQPAGARVGGWVVLTESARGRALIRIPSFDTSGEDAQQQVREFAGASRSCASSDGASMTSPQTR